MINVTRNIKLWRVGRLRQALYILLLDRAKNMTGKLPFRSHYDNSSKTLYKREARLRLGGCPLFDVAEDAEEALGAGGRRRHLHPGERIQPRLKYAYCNALIRRPQLKFVGIIWLLFA